MRPIKTIAILQLLTINLFGQADSCWTVLLVGKSNELEMKHNMGSFSKTGFYMYRNCVYAIETKNGHQFGGRLIDIKPDTLFFTNFFNANVAAKAGIRLDTVGLHYRQLDKLRLISDRSMLLYTKHAFDNFDFIFKKDTARCSLSSDWVVIFTNDTMPYELVLVYPPNNPTIFGMVKRSRLQMGITLNSPN